VKITVALSTCDAWTSKLIRWFTGSDVSHALIIVDFEMVQADGTAHPRMVLEATATGFGLRLLSEFLKTNTIMLEAEPPGELVKGYLGVLNLLEEAYDYEGIVGIALVGLARRLGKRIQSPVHSSHALFCSEATVRMLQLARSTPFLPLDAPSTAPSDLEPLFAPYKVT
jgi:hypothetical protein